MNDVTHNIDVLEIYHENTKNHLWPKRNRKAHQIHYAKFVLELMATGPKTYENRTKLDLPKKEDMEEVDVSFETVLRTRHSSRHFGEQPLSLKDLAKVLFFANGITNSYISAGYQNYRRNVPSSGNLGSIEIYPFITNVAGANPGIYHYNPLKHELDCLRLGNFRKEISERMIYQPEFADAGALLVLSALIQRVKKKYGERAYRYVHLDAGHIGENVYLTCSALGIGCCATAGFIDEEVNAFIGIDSLNETVVYILAIGQSKLEY